MSESSQLGILPQAITLSSLMLMGPQKGPTQFDSFEKNSSPNLDGSMQVQTRQLRRISQGKNR